MSFFFEVLIGGLLSGVMYSLVALGFVLIYKASGVFNFAQGSMVFFAALTFVGFMEHGLSFWLALPATLVAMIVLGILIERVVLRPLVNQPHTYRPRTACCRRRPPGCTRRGHPLAADLGDRVGGRRRRGAGRRPVMGRTQRCAVRADLCRTQGAAGADPGRIRVDPGRHRR